MSDRYEAANKILSKLAGTEDDYGFSLTLFEEEIIHDHAALLHKYLSEDMILEEILKIPDLDEGFKDSLVKAKKYAEVAIKKLQQAKTGLKKEGELTSEMIDTFFRLLKSMMAKYKSEKPTNDEVKKALFQLKQVGKVGFVGALLMGPIPGDEPLIIILEIVARRFGWSILPPSLQGIF